MAKVSIARIRERSRALLVSWGVPDVQAALIADTIAYAHRRGKHTHGVTRLGIYRRKIMRGLMTPETRCETVKDFAALAVLDCGNGFGQVAADAAMRLAVEKAARFGMGSVFVRNSNNFGVAGYFAEIASAADMAGFVVTASAPAVAPPGGRKAIFGTNPYCYAFPSRNGGILLDMSVSVAARGKIRLALKNGENIPPDWAVDENGRPTVDPAAALRGNLTAIGGFKGFGLALVADVLGGLLSGSAFGGAIRPLAAEDGPSRHGHFLSAIDISKLMDEDEYARKMSELEANVKACGASGAVLLPGERSRRLAETCGESVELKQSVVDEFESLEEGLG